MKKTVLTSVLLLLLCVILLHKYLSPNIEYETGKDTHECFGNGQYQLLTSSKSANEKQYSLFNVKYPTPIIDKVIEYRESKDTVYFYGEHKGNTVYAFLYLEDNQIIYCQPEGDIDILYAYDMMKENELEIIYNLSDFERKTKINN